MFSPNEYFTFRLDEGKTLLTTRHGGWAFLSDEEYHLFKAGNLNQDSELFLILEKAGLILTGKSTGKIIRDLRVQNNFVSIPTAYHVIAITNKCNFNCIYCHPDASPYKDEMSGETADKVLDFIFSIPMFEGCQIIIEGGEPLLKWDLIKYLFHKAKKKAAEKNLRLRFSFTTNLSLMTDEIAKDISDMKINPCVSFDGPKELHNKQRPFYGGGESYDKVVYWFKRLKEKYKLRVNAIPVITNLSLKYGPKAIIDEYLKLGMQSVFFKPFRASGRALDDFQELGMKAEDFYEFWRDGIEYCLSLQKKGMEMKELNTIYMVGNIFSPYRKSMCHRRPCGAGFSILSYNTDGTINGCDSTRGQGFLDLGHVGKDDYQTIRSRALPLLALIPDAVPICTNCPFVSYCTICLADTYGRENDIYPKIPRSFSCQWQKLAFAYLFRKISDSPKDAEILRKWGTTR